MEIKYFLVNMTKDQKWFDELMETKVNAKVWYLYQNKIYYEYPTGTIDELRAFQCIKFPFKNETIWISSVMSGDDMLRYISCGI